MQLVELVGVDDFALTIARQLLFSSYQWVLYEELRKSTDDTLAAVAAKAVKSLTTATMQAVDAAPWRRHRRQPPPDARWAWPRTWPYVAELFEMDDLVRDLARDGIAVDVAALRPAWDDTVDNVLREATLARPNTWQAPGGGRRGVHTEAMGYLLAEMQHLHRSHPGATW